MKWLKSRSRYLNEAKIKDYILPGPQKKEFIKLWGEKWLEYEEVDPTENIKQGKWKISDEDKNEVLSAFFNCNINRVFKDFDGLPDKFVKTLTDSIDFSLYSVALKEKASIIFENFDAKRPTVDQLSLFNQAIFRSISVNETKADSIIQRDEQGHPLKDEEGKIIKIKKEPGVVIYSKNLVNIRGFADDYNRCYEKERIDSEKLFSNGDISNLISLSNENHNTSYKFDFKIFDRDMYISIDHNPRNILNMSVSKFYASCMHLYSGGYRNKVLSNIFDPNSMPAFLIFDTEIYWDKEKIADFLPISRLMIRNIETFVVEKTPKIFYDRAYPDRMQSIFVQLLDKYTGNKQTVTNTATRYIYTPDIDLGDNIDQPYMDKLGLTHYPYIGKNTKALYLNRTYDWSKIKISPNANIKELIVETEVLPKDFNLVNMKPEWVKFRYMTISNLTPFDNIVTKSLAFEKCKFSISVLDKLADKVEKLQINSSDIVDDIDFSKFTSLKELYLLYTLDSYQDLYKIENLKLDNLILSGDLFSSKEAKEYLKSLKKKMKIEIIGPVI